MTQELQTHELLFAELVSSTWALYGATTAPHIFAKRACAPLAARGNMDIADWRNKIDQLDEQIVKLLSERAAAAVAIGEIKRQNAAPIYEPQREQQVYKHARGVNPGPLTGAQVQDIYERIMDVMRSLQRPDHGAGKQS